MRWSTGARRRMLAAVVGVAIVAGSVAALASKPPYVVESCTRDDLGGQSVARVWNEQVLALIRQVVPAPTVHARNLFHLSAAMWDAWAAYDPAADGYLVTEKATAGDVTAAREAAMTNVAGIAADTAQAIVQKLTGKAPTAAELAAARG